jgi:pimeloyl-ACP methyl ester carboxylesterase
LDCRSFSCRFERAAADLRTGLVKIMRRRVWLWRGVVIGVALLAIFGNAIAVDSETRPAAPRDGGRLIDTGIVAANVKVEGAGAPILLIHGFAAAINWWDAIAPALLADHRLIMVDLVGHGGTAAPLSDYSIERQAAMVGKVLDALGVDRVAVIGHSMGGDVATALVQQRPDRIDRLILIDSPPTAAERHNVLTDLYLTPVLGEMLSRFRSERLLRSALKQAFAPGFPVPVKFADDVRQLTYTAFRSAQAASVAFRAAKPLNERLSAVRPIPPLLVIAGSADAMVPSDDWKLFEQVSHARIVTLAGVGHSPMVEVPGQTVDLIKLFLSDRD